MIAFTRNVLGLLLGFLAGLLLTSPLVAQAQTIIKTDPALKVCWDQPTSPDVPDLAALNAMKVRVTYDAQLVPVPAPTPVTFTCEGTASPYQCTVKTDTPPSALTVGTHRYIVEASALDPTDGTYGPWTVVNDFTETLRNAPVPSQGNNGHLVKRIFTAVVAALKMFWAWLT